MSEPSAQAHERRPVRRALVSVYEKAGLPELAEGLHKLGVEIVSTGSTAQRIADTGVPVTAVEELTGFPECLDGRVKTLHPNVHAGLLADTRRPEHLAQLDELGIAPFDLLVANLYPFTETVASGATPDECVEQIDIGGPAMVRASAKNHDSVAVVVDPERYGWLLDQVEAGGFTLDDRRRLAAAAFRHTATYDVAVASWLGSVLAPDGDGPFPAWVGATWERASTLRYGENPHQAAALYTAGRGGLAGAEQLHGKEMSYNNYVDADAAWRAAHDHGDVPTVAVIKHTNPCGIAVGADVAEAHRKAHATDPVSAFGGVIATNGEVSAAMAEQVAEVFTEVVLAPSYAPEALEILTRKKNVRLLRLPDAGARGGRRDAADLRWPAPAAARPGRRPRRRSRLVDAGHRRPRAGRRAGRPRLRLAGLPRGEVQRDPAGLGRGGRRDRDGPGEPGGLGAPRGRAGRRPGPRVGGRLRRVLPVPGRAGGPAGGRGPGGRAAGRLGARQPGRRGRGGRGRADVPHRDAPLRALRGLWLDRRGTAVLRW